MSDDSDSDVSLREVRIDDLPILFEQQTDPQAIHMAAFTSQDPTDRVAFMEQWHGLLADKTIFNRVIIFREEVAGYVVKFDFEREPHIGYWLGRVFWGKGIASRAVADFLRLYTSRPLKARVAHDNKASRRVLEKNGFVVIAEDSGYAFGRGAETKEYILQLS